MKNRTETIRRMVSYLNDSDKDGGFWLPNIQRPFVWSEEQISRLFDSLMRQYPVSTLLVWKTRSPIRRRKFIDNYKQGLKLSTFYVPVDSEQRMLVLDGQQRLQSLFIGLDGSYEGKELYFDLLSGDLSAPEDMRFTFEFRNGDDGEPRWIKFKDVVFSNEKSNRLARQLIERFGGSLAAQQEDRIDDNVSQIAKVFKEDEVIVFQELDSVDNPKLYKDDDVVEVFIRANSGGTRLDKSDLLFSLLSSTWDASDEEMEQLLDDLNRTGYDFSRDFVLKTCLALLKTGARYDVAKLRDENNRKGIIDHWDAIAKAIKDVKDFVYGKTYIRSDKAFPSYLVLIPLIYFRYHYPEQWRSASSIDEYIVRSSLTRAFSGSPDNLIDKLTTRIDSVGNFDLNAVYGEIRSQNRALEITEDALWDMGYGGREVHLLFNLWYRDFNYTPAFEGNAPQVDHVFPQSLLKTVKVANPETGVRNLMKYKKSTRDQLANCMLLTADENGAGGKTDIPPDQWFKEKSSDYLNMHLIPPDPDLWKLERFEDFLHERKKLIGEKFSDLLLGK